MTKKGFFREIEEDRKAHSNLMYLTLLLGTILLWVYVAIPGQEKNAIIYIFLLVTVGIVGSADFLATKKEGKLVVFNGVGKNFLMPAVFGAVAVVAISIVQPQILIAPLSIVSPTTISFLFIVVAAPFTEALFFRGALQPGIVKLIEDNLIKDNFVAGSAATVIQSFAFAWFHINIFGATGNFVPYFVFGVIATLGVYAFRNISFEFGLHGLNNFFAFSAMTAVS